MKFEEFPFEPSLQKAIAEIGFVDCTPVQEQSFQAYFAGKDIYAQSQTGTGKTAAFMLCGLQELIHRNRERDSSQNAETQGTETSTPNTQEMEAQSADTELAEQSSAESQEPTFAGDIKMLILSPTRELAEQIEQEAKLLSQFLPIQVAAFYGGVGYEKQRAHLDSGVQIITGTPGRIIDLAKSGELPLGQVQVIVLDEADRMLDMGFIDDVRWVMAKLPLVDERLTMLYSATLTAKVGNLSWEFMRAEKIAEIIIEPEQITTENIEQELYHVSNQEKLRLLLSLIKKYEPEAALIFCNTKSGASFLEGRLRANGYQVKALMGDLPQVKRTQIVGQLKAGKLRFVVATDVASRGLHIDGLPLVINYDLPDEAENYVHRIGRTARAGASGRAVSLACERYVYNLTDIERYIEEKIPVFWFPEEELVEHTGPSSPSTERRSRDAEYRSDSSGGRGDRGGRSNDRGHSRSGQRDRQSKGTANQYGDKSTRPVRSSRRPEGANGAASQPNRSESRGSRTGKPYSHGRDARREFSKDIPKDKDERLKFYQQKYGEDFGAAASGETDASPNGEGAEGSRGPQRKRAFAVNHRRNRSSQQHNADSTRQNANGQERQEQRPSQTASRRRQRSSSAKDARTQGQTGRHSTGKKPEGQNRGTRNHGNNGGRKPQNVQRPQPSDKAAEAAKAPVKKPGLLQRLFGKK